MRKSTLILGITSASALAACLWLWTQWQRARAVPIQAQASVSHCPETPAVQLMTPQAAPPIVASPPGKQSQVSPSVNVPLGRNMNELEQRLMKDPEYRQALRDQFRPNVEEEYRDLPGFLGLTGERADRLFDLLAGQNLRILDARWQKADDEKTRFAAFEEARAKNEAELADFLGPADTRRLQEYRATQESRNEVNSVRSELARGAEPLRRDQVEPMIDLVNAELQRMHEDLQRESQQARQAGPGLPPGFDPVLSSKRTDVVIATNQRILESARSILSGTQLAGLEALYRRQRLQMLSQDEVNRLRLEVIPPMTFESTGTP